ncbi:MAG TPA: tRNA lysidine(34) synthetase TilS [Actinotalea sp.]|nr:tRNA lysidine(34) synthetase TilS [Actinotalea sp.]
MSGPHPAVAVVRSAVRAELTLLAAGADDGALVLVACSGGADSLALAAAAAFVAPRVGLRAGAVVVDHRLLAGSADVAARAADQCRDLGLSPVEVVATTVGGSGGPEAAARMGRYAALADVADRYRAVAVLLGHTLDDQAETVLLGLARGSGARSLAGMPARRGLLRRPLLGVRRAQTLEACEAQGLVPWHDPTNTPADGPDLGEANRRAVVRHEVLPVLERALGPGVALALARTADQLRADTEVLEDLADQLLAAAREGGGPVGALDVVRLGAAPEAVRRRALHAALAGWGFGAPHAVHVEAVDALAVGWRGQGAAAVPGGSVVRRYGRLAPDVST